MNLTCGPVNAVRSRFDQIQAGKHTELTSSSRAGAALSSESLGMLVVKRGPRIQTLRPPRIVAFNPLSDIRFGYL
jgi:hypothetical protein